jgi:hypothetical protein
MWAVIGIVAGLWVLAALVGGIALGKAMRRHKQRPRPDMVPIAPAAPERPRR